MEPFSPDENVASARKSIIDQTGKKTGEATGLCHLLVTHALTGADVDFTIKVTRDNQLKVESETGLENYPITVGRGVLLSDAVTKILQQDKVPLKALLLTGRVNHPDSRVDETHVIAVVQDKEGKYAVIDSLHEDAIEKFDDEEGVADRVNGRFDSITRPLSYSVILTAEEQARRRSDPKHQIVMIDREIYI